jgi:hypothetical protein
MMSLVFKKTELGLAEIRSKSQSLGLHERRALILMDGSRKLSDVQALLGASVDGIAKRLLDLGLINTGGGGRSASAPPASSVEFKDSLLGKTPAMNFDSYDNYLPTLSKVWETGDYPQGFNGHFVPSIRESEAAPLVSRSASLASRNAPLDSGNAPWESARSPLRSQPADLSSTRPAPLAQQGLSPRGVLLGKMYLADLVERMMGKDDEFLRRKIQQIRSEDVLYSVCEEVMEYIKGMTSEDMLVSIEKRFMESISKK